MDKLDMNIIEALREDGRITSTKLSSKFSVNEGTIRNRIKKLIDSGFLSVKGLINPSLVADKNVITVGINISSSKDLIDVAKKIANIPSVHSVLIASGKYDIIIELFIETSKYADFLTKELSCIESVTSTDSFISLNCIKKWV